MKQNQITAEAITTDLGDKYEIISESGIFTISHKDLGMLAWVDPAKKSIFTHLYTTFTADVQVTEENEEDLAAKAGNILKHMLGDGWSERGFKIVDEEFHLIENQPAEYRALLEMRIKSLAEALEVLAWMEGQCFQVHSTNYIFLEP